MKILTPQGFRDSLKTRASRIAKNKGVDSQSIIRQVAFDFFLRRIGASGKFVLKGGYAIELRFHVGRATKDLDLITKAIVAGINSVSWEKIAFVIREKLIDAIEDTVDEVDAFVRFRVGEKAQKVIDGGGTGARFHVAMMVAGDVLDEFHVDLTLPDVENLPTDTLEFNGVIEPTPSTELIASIEVITREQHYAEKIHAYTRPRPDVNTRAKDLIDLIILVRSGIDIDACYNIISSVFAYWGTHEIPCELPAPPWDIWSKNFNELARRCNLEISMEDGYNLVADVHKEILSQSSTHHKT